MPDAFLRILHTFVHLNLTTLFGELLLVALFSDKDLETQGIV